MENKLRIWWVSNPPRKGFIKEAKDLKEAKMILDLLADYDLYLGDAIDCNAGGVERFIDGEWEPVEDEELEDAEL